MNRPDWVKKLNFFSQPNFTKSIIQLVNTLLPYTFLMITSMLLLKHEFSYWIIVPLILISSCFLVRSFILMHDCAHGAFLKSNKTSAIVGHILGILSFTSFFNWRQSHQIHHATVGNLDKRGIGDILTMTVNEYFSLNTIKKIFYRIYRNPITLFLFGPLFTFIISQRIPNKLNGKKECISIFIANTIIIIILTLAYFTIGIKIYLAIQIPVFYLAAIFGIWLFYIQHQFEDVYWEYNEKWDIYRASMEGSSYYKLPKILQWFTGNIELHNLHHLNSRIPNYNLSDSFKKIPKNYNITFFTITYGIKAIFLVLWDEESRKLISFYKLKKIRHSGK